MVVVISDGHGDGDGGELIITAAKVRSQLGILAL